MAFHALSRLLFFGGGGGIPAYFVGQGPLDIHTYIHTYDANFGVFGKIESVMEHVNQYPGRAKYKHVRATTTLCCKNILRCRNF
jgi:hypothetical protein